MNYTTYSGINNELLYIVWYNKSKLKRLFITKQLLASFLSVCTLKLNGFGVPKKAAGGMDIPLSHRKPEAEKFFSEKLGINTYIPLLIERIPI